MLKPETKKIQEQFTLYCRTGDKNYLPTLSNPQHVHHYRRLTLNITKQSLATSYPLLKKYLSSDQWDHLIDLFFSNHACQNNKIWLMPKEFYEYVIQKNIQEEWEIPFLNDLLHLEWIETELYTMEDMPMPAFLPITDIYAQPLVLHPEHKLLQFTFPVHQKNANLIETIDKGIYFLLAYRQQFKVHFLSLSPLYAFIIEQLHASQPLHLILEAAEVLLPNEIDREEVDRFIQTLLSRQFILGTLHH